MKTTGGTDIDWMIEHNSGFIFLEVKRFNDDRIRLPLAQMIAYRNLHEKLNQSGKCYFYIIGADEGFMKDNQDLWIFEMRKWRNGGIVDLKNAITEIEIDGVIKKGYLVERGFMEPMSIDKLRQTIEKHWDEFKNKSA